MTIDRNKSRAKSNNPSNPNKNVCGLAILRHLRAENLGRYCHTLPDIVYNLRKKYTVRSRMSTLAPPPISGKLRSVGFIRREIKAHEKKLSKSYDGLNIITHGYLVYVSSHVLFLDTNGDTIVDTAPRHRDHRKVKSVYVVYSEVTP
jgi:hypothetical protein